MVLCYSHWEGYFNDLTEEVFRGISESGIFELDFTPGIRCVVLRADLDRLASSKADDDNILRFLNRHADKSGGESRLSLNILKSRSTLNWARLCVVFSIYGISWPPFEKDRIFIDHKLSKIRHQIAHGEAPRLTKELVLETIDKTLTLLDELVEYFAKVREKLT